MYAQTALRLCHSGMDSRALYAFEIFLSRIGPNACQISDEGAADVALIDVDTELGPYLLKGHRLLYPSRPLIVTTQAPGGRPDPLTIEVAKPIGLTAFSAALTKVRRLLPPSAISLRDVAEGTELNLEAIPDELQITDLQALQETGTAHTRADRVLTLRQMEERLSILYVGSMPDVDLDNPTTHTTLFYAPENFLQGTLARAIAHAREIDRPMRINDASGAALFLDPRSGLAYPTRSANAMRALAQLPTRGTVSMARLEPRDAPLLDGLVSRPLEALEWDLALWASRGRLPCGTHLDHPIRLHCWPNLTRLAVPPEAMRIAGLWSRGSISLRETVRVLGVPQRYVFAFYSACHALGLVEQISLPSALPGSRLAPAAAAPAQPAPPPRGLFKRLLGKLLGARLNEDATD
jgi:hypothetical protein